MRGFPRDIGNVDGAPKLHALMERGKGKATAKNKIPNTDIFTKCNRTLILPSSTLRGLTVG